MNVGKLQTYSAYIQPSAEKVVYVVGHTEILVEIELF